MIEDASAQLRRRPELRVSRHDLLAGPDVAAADAEQPAGGVRAAVRRRQHRRRARGAPAAVAQPARLGARRSSALQRKLPAADRSRLDQYLDRRPRDRAPRFRRPGSRLSDDLSLPDAPDRRAEGRRGAHQADVRSAGARLAGGDHARHHVPAREGAEQRRLPEERRPRRVPHPVAPLEHPREQGPVRGAEPLSRRAVRVLPRQAAGDARWRRHAARSLDGAVRQRA